VLSYSVCAIMFRRRRRVFLRRHKLHIIKLQRQVVNRLLNEVGGLSTDVAKIAVGTRHKTGCRQAWYSALDYAIGRKSGDDRLFQGTRI